MTKTTTNENDKVSYNGADKDNNNRIKMTLAMTKMTIYKMRMFLYTLPYAGKN